jgi:hypothetical protein
MEKSKDREKKREKRDNGRVGSKKEVTVKKEKREKRQDPPMMIARINERDHNSTNRSDSEWRKSD